MLPARPRTTTSSGQWHEMAKNSRGGWEEKKPRLSHSQPVSHLNLCHLLNLFSNASDALRAARADGRHYVPLSLNRLGRVINTHGDILVSNANIWGG